MKIRSVLLLLIISASTVQAAPQVTAISGTILDGQTLAVGGTDFGTKSSGAPMVWDNVESGQFSSAWGDTKDLSVTSSGQRHSRSTRSGFLNFGNGNWDGDFQAGSSTYQKWFVQYWFKVDSNWDWGSSTYGGGNSFLSNIKIFRMWNPGDTTENFVVALNGWENSAEFVMEGTGEPRRYLLGDYKNLFTKGNWHLLQFEYADNSSVGASDGEFRCWFDGRLVANQVGMKTRESFSGFKRPFIVGFSNVWEASGGSENTPNNFYIDDVYVDNTWARVELGNSPSYSACTVREVQPVVSWGGTALQVKVNAGSFGNNQTAYLYVVNSDGEVNATGVPVTVGGTVTGTIPGGGDPGTVGGGTTDLPVAIDKKSNLVIKPSEQKMAKISYAVNEPTGVKITVQQRFGEEVRTLENSYKDRGVYEIQWNGQGSDGGMVASGIYMIVFETGGQVLRQKVVLIK